MNRAATLATDPRLGTQHPRCPQARNNARAPTATVRATQHAAAALAKTVALKMQHPALHTARIAKTRMPQSRRRPARGHLATTSSTLLSKSMLTSSIRLRPARRQITPSDTLALVRDFGTKTNGCHLGAHVLCNLASRKGAAGPTPKQQLQGAMMAKIAFETSRNGAVWGFRSWGRYGPLSADGVEAS
ncbi:uncharacterized protein CC84DRAFT_896423 [Paraphaeosphaeria sporulosa]|uniref:Uncharacterized protein n=1 Tax=Paraphaeosphaeria sporulosa TaxID=1460663 RepID=A0A177C4R8_9PLEO|nr:uncharacterized protein CC84DRAFT_896423 [Paraphaeosphaeria sporulosa]OAG02495.1 hypothetical protein CC84DRAFT_896423 [Paraphaeosphaeria sporulosa]